MTKIDNSAQNDGKNNVIKKAFEIYYYRAFHNKYYTCPH